jgi:ribulose-5-phosphate 4-epimerase/fuculose-1-phosphate aldolase
VRDLGDRKAMILRNHGLLVCAGSIPETFDLMYYLERACQTQIAAMAGGGKLRVPAAAVAEKTAAQFKALPYKPRRPEWKALLRMLDKSDASYKE